VGQTEEEAGKEAVVPSACFCRVKRGMCGGEKKRKIKGKQGFHVR
jgi:hypothetical protein